jgi:adenine/guanine phosphoribosyltransferase-like PRPP-binding protein
MAAPDTSHDPAMLALQALIWTLAEPARASRLLDVTGLTPADLKASAGDPATLSALLSFLENHEPDLIACAEGIGVTPAALVAAHRSLEA